MYIVHGLQVRKSEQKTLWLENCLENICCYTHTYDGKICCFEILSLIRGLILRTPCTPFYTISDVMFAGFRRGPQLFPYDAEKRQ